MYYVHAEMQTILAYDTTHISRFESDFPTQLFCPCESSLANSHSRLQMGQVLLLCNHRVRHLKWNAWAQVPQTTGLSSPGNSDPGAQPSSGFWQMAQTSSLADHVQDATACTALMRTRTGMVSSTIPERKKEASRVRQRNLGCEGSLLLLRCLCLRC